MIIKLNILVEVDEKKYPNLKKSKIREIVKAYEYAGDVVLYLDDQIKSELEQLNFDFK